MKTQWKEDGRREELGHNTGNGEVMLRPQVFQYAEFVFQLGTYNSPKSTPT